MSSEIVVALPLLKISSATTSAHTRPIPWDHDESPNLQILFERLPASQLLNQHPAEIQLKIIKGIEVLEDINLNDLARADEIDTKFEVIVQSPCIAMKYPTSDCYTRRFQIRFRQNQHYAQAIDILHKSGVSLAPPRQRLGPVATLQQSVRNSNGETVVQPSQLLNVSRHNDLTQNTLQSSGLSQTLVASQKLKIPAFQNRSPAPVNGILASELYKNDWRIRKELTGNKSTDISPSIVVSSSAPGPVGRIVPRAFDKTLTFSSTMPIDLTKIAYTELPPIRKLPFDTKSNRSKTGAVRAATAVTHAQDRLDVLDTDNEKPLQKNNLNAERKQVVVQNNRNESQQKTKQNLTADEIDTQKLLARVAGRVSRPKEARSKPSDPSSRVEIAVQEVQTASQNKKNTACRSCKSAHRRCIKDPEDPEGTCRPCLNAKKHCSLTPAHENQEKPHAAAASVQAELQQEVLTQDSVSEPNKDSELSKLHSRSQTSKNVSGSQTGWKRRSQEEMPPPPRKRFKEQQRHDSQDQQASDLHSSISLPRIRKPLSLRAKARGLANANIQSDATTATVETDDLNHRPALRVPRLTPRRRLSSDRPAFSEISNLASAHLDELMSIGDMQSDIDDGASDEALESDTAHCPTLSAQLEELPASGVTLSNLSKLTPDIQNRMITNFLDQALHDPNFLNLCKIIQASPAFSVLAGKI